METVCHLHCLGCADRCSQSIRWRTVTADDLYAIVSLEPVAQGLSFTVGQQVNDAMSHQVNKDGAVAPPPTESEVINTKHTRCAGGWQLCSSYSSEQSIRASLHC